METDGLRYLIEPQELDHELHLMDSWQNWFRNPFIQSLKLMPGLNNVNKSVKFRYISSKPSQESFPAVLKWEFLQAATTKSTKSTSSGFRSRQKTCKSIRGRARSSQSVTFDGRSSLFLEVQFSLPRAAQFLPARRN